MSDNNSNNKLQWRLIDNIYRLDDKYAIRYVEPLDYRVIAYIWYNSTATFSEKVAIWYEDFADKQSAIEFAEAWAIGHSPIEREVYGISGEIRFAYGVVEPRVEVEQRG